MLALEARWSDACHRIDAQIAAAMADDRAEAIVLGCAGVADSPPSSQAVTGCR